MFFYATYITPAMIMRLTGIGSQYIGAFADSRGEYFDGAKTYKVTLPAKVPAVVLVPDGLRQSVALDARHAATLSARRQSDLSDARRRTERRWIYDGVLRPETTRRHQARQLDPDDAGKGWNVLLRLYSPLEPSFTKSWRPSEIELVTSE